MRWQLGSPRPDCHNLVVERAGTGLFIAVVQNSRRNCADPHRSLRRVCRTPNFVTAGRTLDRGPGDYDIRTISICALDCWGKIQEPSARCTCSACTNRDELIIERTSSRLRISISQCGVRESGDGCRLLLRIGRSQQLVTHCSFYCPPREADASPVAVDPGKGGDERGTRRRLRLSRDAARQSEDGKRCNRGYPCPGSLHQTLAYWISQSPHFLSRSIVHVPRPRSASEKVA
jgi:hypothetical protein